ncbi:hypothetical protein HYV86_00405 [Candidatus Woesearchaeota archaeon]|nr:hypothetical protein [Candidatus Woesearchaeota archaeon]
MVGLKMRLIFVAVFALLIMPMLALAANTNISVTEIDNTIKPSEYATFQLTVFNAAPKTQSFKIYSLQSGIGWAVEPFPLSDRVVQVGSDQTYTTTIRVHPSVALKPGSYFVDLIVEKESGEKLSTPLQVFLTPERPFDYLPALTVDVDMDEKIVPGVVLPIRLFIENKNVRDLTDVSLTIQSEVGGIEKEVSIDLAPKEKKTVELTLMPNQYQSPKSYVIFFTFAHNGQTFKVVDKTIEIVPVLSPFVITSSTQESFLMLDTTLTIRNQGNVLNTQEVPLVLPAWKFILTHSDTAVKRIQSDSKSLVWNMTLSPNESATVMYRTNYRLIIYAAVLLIGMIVFYIVVRSPVSIKKTAVITKINHSEGAFSEIKVTIEIRNKTKELLRNLTVHDVVPAIGSVEKPLEVGTLKPQHLTSGVNGTKATWTIAELEGLEHRLITYKVHAKLNVLGSIKLPRTVVEFSKKKKGTLRKSYSNACEVQN